MAKQPKTAITPTREEDYPEWYQQVVKAGDMAEVSPVRGCMIIKPWGYAVWENMQKDLDRMFKDTGHENAYFPLFIPKRFLEKEAEHVEGFAKECAVVTHSRLEMGEDGKLHPAGKLEEEYIVRPTSETIIGDAFSRWVQSYRDLPIKLNQWANVVRWELRTRMFLRTAEFLWQEGHTVHANSEEAWEETRLMLDVYADFAENYMAMPVIKGEKTADERFPGAVSTLTIEAMMQDRKALQAGTTHFLGQNFAHAQDIKFQSKDGVEEFAWTTSWGVSTRLVGALIMTHADDDGMVIPPRLAPKQIVLLPIYRSDEERTDVLAFCDRVKKELEAQCYEGECLRVLIDDRDMRGGEKNWQHIKRGVPIRAEVGPRDVAGDSVFMARRDRGHGKGDKENIGREEFVSTAVNMLAEMQNNLYQKALDLRTENTRSIETLDEFKAYFTPKSTKKPEIHGGFAECYFTEGEEMQAVLKKLAVTTRCIPLNQEPSEGKCVFTGADSKQKAIFAKAY